MNPLRSFFLQLSRIPPAIMLVVIVGLALVTTVLVSDLLRKKEAASEAAIQAYNDKMKATTKVVYAVKDIPEGQTIPSDALEERPVQEAKAPQDAVTSSTLAAGQVAKYGISNGSIISNHDLAPKGMSPGFSTRLKDGMRAITFAVDNNSGVAGFVSPESRVDIISMVGSGAETKAAPILSDVEIIAVGSTIERSNNGAAIPSSSVTVAVTPDDGQKLIKGICASKLYLSLRNDKDHIPVATSDVGSLFGRTNLRITEDTSRALRDIPPPPLSSLQIPAQAIGSATPVSTMPGSLGHEVETWSGGKKDIVTFAGQ